MSVLQFTVSPTGGLSTVRLLLEDLECISEGLNQSRQWRDRD